MPRPAECYVDYNGRTVSLSQLARLAGLNYITVLRRWQRGIRDVGRLTVPSQRGGGKCTVLSSRECLHCRFSDCIRPESDHLEDENYSIYLR